MLFDEINYHLMCSTTTSSSSIERVFDEESTKDEAICRCAFRFRLPRHRKFHRMRTTTLPLFGHCRPRSYHQTGISWSAMLVASLLLLLTTNVHCDRGGDVSDLEDSDYFSTDDNNNNAPMSSYRKLYTNQFAVRLDDASEEEADGIAAKYGFTNNGRILNNYFSFTRPTLRKRSARNARHLRFELASDPKVNWIEQQVAKRRVKRDLPSPRFPRQSDCTDLNNPRCRSSRTFHNTYNYDPNDPEWINMWYLNRRSLNFDHNVKEAWALGVTGKDVVVTILDDGLEIKHPDIERNYDPQASYDINQNDADPTPRYDLTNENRHGTRCAGEVAAEFNNSMCIVGVAFQASIGGIKMLDGDVTDVVEAQSLSHNRQHVHIYSASWGPDDDGKTVDGPAKLASLAFKEGVEQGRGGKGSIFVWASGNGGRDADSCNCDGYTNSIYTLSISSATENGNVPWYSEACSSTVATTYSSGSHGERMIVTTDLHYGCTNGHTGTSASAPLAAGICALALHANPNLTWRDLQHIVIRTAKPDNLRASDWGTNAVGRNVSHSFGYGLMDAGAMVRLARNWTTVPTQKRCSVLGSGNSLEIASRAIEQARANTGVCGREGDSNVVYVEHVQARVTLSLSNSAKRGDIQIFLTSPRGTRSTLLAKRARDTSKVGFRDWAFMTTHSWGEHADGEWILEVQNDAWGSVTLQRFELVVWGTSTPVGPFGGGASESSAGQLSASLARCCSWTPLNLCAGCSEGYALYQNGCVDVCPSQYYLHKSSSLDNDQDEKSSCGAATCKFCASFCLKCSGADGYDCSECIRGFSMLDGKCVKSDNGLSINGLRSIPATSDDQDDRRPFITRHYEVIVGATIVGVLAVSMLIVLVWFVNKKRSRSSSADQQAPVHSQDHKNCLKIFCNNWVLAKFRRKAEAPPTELIRATISTAPWVTGSHHPAYLEARL